jgi:lysyl-tRNA synthetase class 2
MALSRIGDPADRDCVIVLCYDDDKRLAGLLQFTPWGENGLSLDLMRSDRTAGNGMVELMIVSALRAAPALGIERMSLNFALFCSIFERAEQLGAGPALRLWHRFLKALSRFCQIESLYRANVKYQPSWQPRYLCFPKARDLPRILIATLQAEAFLPAGRSTSRRDEPSAARRRSRPSTRIRPRRPFVRPASTLSAFPSVRHASGFAAVVQQRRMSQGRP